MSATVAAPPKGQSLLFTEFTWKEYVNLLTVFAHRRVRLTYDRGVLEIMTISSEHERYKHLLGRLIEALTEELDLPIAGFGSFTCKRKKKQRGLEPDECYWVASEPLVRGKDSIDLDRDPPPDLAVEIEVTQSLVDRLSVYAALQVPEIWRYNGTDVTFHQLQKGGKKYVETATSRSFPKLTPGDLQQHLNLRGQMDENKIVRRFRQWVRQSLLPGEPS